MRVGLSPEGSRGYRGMEEKRGKFHQGTLAKLP